jgi:hypothetical protein
MEGSVCSILGKQDALEHLFDDATIDLTPKRLNFELRDSVCGRSSNVPHESESADFFTFIEGVLSCKIHLA